MNTRRDLAGLSHRMGGWLVFLVFGIVPYPIWGGLLYVDGHGDIGVGYEPIDPMFPSGPKELYPHWHLGDGAGASVVGFPNIMDQEFDPSEITAVVPLSSKFTNPGGPTWAFLGGDPASDIYFLPQNNPPAMEIPFLGIASDDLEPAEWSNLTWNIALPNTAPGAFSIFANGVFGPSVLYSSTAGPAGFSTSVGSHDHFNLAFTQPGYYDLALTISGTHITDGFKSSSGTFQFLVGEAASVPEPTAAMLLATVGSFCLATHRRRRPPLRFDARSIRCR